MSSNYDYNDPAAAMGQPMQVHAVPLEDRAFDNSGRRLPYAKEWPEGHPLSRGQKRQVEEKGPFGRSSRRKGSSRATRTTTPAKKENPAIDGFLEAWEYDQQRAFADSEEQESASRAPKDGNTSGSNPPSLSKEPTQVFLYGFAPGKSYAAIDFYESVSGGIICEDYDRKAPNRRFPDIYSSPAPGRTLTKAERSLAAQYHGGDCWVKVTFDSAEAAERAIHNSPHRIEGHWVYAQEFRGVGPELDEPILVKKDDVQQAAGSAYRPSKTLGPSFAQSSKIRGRGGVNTLPKSFTTNTTTSQSGNQRANEDVSQSSSTASSATATDVSYPDLRQRLETQADQHEPSLDTQQNGSITSGRQTLIHFPDVPRTNIRPASEAFLPQPSWSEKMISRLVNTGLIPGDFIGNGPPRLANGDFDYKLASYYWRFFYWIDNMFATDLCGLKEA